MPYACYHDSWIFRAPPEGLEPLLAASNKKNPRLAPSDSSPLGSSTVDAGLHSKAVLMRGAT